MSSKARRTSFYLDKRNAKWLGVCSGIADYTGYDVTLVRIAMVGGTILMWGGLFVVYIIAAMVASDRPRDLYENAEEAKFWQGVRQSSTRSTSDVRSKFRDIDRRMADVEAHYTARNTRLADEIDNLK
jgi:phage shock protein C